MQFNGIMKEIKTIKKSMTKATGASIAYLEELSIEETGLNHSIFQLTICYDYPKGKEPLKKHFHQLENANKFISEYFEKNPPQKGFVLFDETMLDDFE